MRDRAHAAIRGLRRRAERVEAAIPERWRRVAARAGEQVELRLVASLLIVVALGWAFAELTDSVLEHETHAFDRALLLALREPGDPSDPLGPGWMHEVGRDVTALGGVAVLGLLTAAVLGYLWIRRQHRAASVLLAGVLGAALASPLLKRAFDRPRPELVPHMAEVYSASFPSGHAMMSAATYLLLGMMLARVHRERRVRAYLVAASTLIALLVGVSRVYVGVHWPTDVLAGWALGALWAIVVWTVAEWPRSRRRAAAREAPAAGAE
jgi:undecaprenyl-diphosphatase